MSLSRRRLLRVAATGAAVGLAGCSGPLDSGTTPDGGAQAEATVDVGMGRGNTPFVRVLWKANQRADYLTVTVENTSSGETVETALCGVGATVTYNGTNGQTNVNGPVGSPPDCESGSPSGLGFGSGDTVSVTVTAHYGSDTTVEIAAVEEEVPEPGTPTPTSSGS